MADDSTLTHLGTVPFTIMEMERHQREKWTRLWGKPGTLPPLERSVAEDIIEITYHAPKAIHREDLASVVALGWRIVEMAIYGDTLGTFGGKITLSRPLE